MMVQPADHLNDLDWHELRCQNQRHECSNQATHIIERHAVDECNTTGHPFGNIVEILCGQCLWELDARIDELLARMRWFTPRPAIPSCFTCGCPIAESSDILRSTKAIR